MYSLRRKINTKDQRNIFKRPCVKDLQVLYFLVPLMLMKSRSCKKLHYWRKSLLFFLMWKYTFCFCNPLSSCLKSRYFKSLFLASLNIIANKWETLIQDGLEVLQASFTSWRKDGWGRKSPETVSSAPQKRLAPEKGRWYFHRTGTVALNHSCVSAQVFASGDCPNTNQHILLPDPPTWGTGVTHCECCREGDSSHVELNLDQHLQCTCPRGWQNSKINANSCHGMINVS